MLSRSGLSIRKLIPNRRLSDEDLGGAEIKREDGSLTSWTDHDSNGSVYAANRRSGRKKQAPAPIIATSPLTHSDALRPLPPLPSETPRSSASSSCRCDRHTRCDCPLLNSKRRSPLYSISPKETRGDVTLASCVNSSDPDDTLAQHIPKSRFNSLSDANPQEEVTRASSLNETNKEQSASGRQLEGTLSPELSSDARQFMRETEDAFKAIGTTLSEVHDQTPIFQTTKANSTDVPRDIEPPPPTPPPKETPVPLSKSPPARVQSMFGSSPKSQPKDNSPPQIPKRKKSKKSKRTRSMRPSRKPTAGKPAVKSGPRWTLTENVSELLTGKLFHKIEADEMLTPEQIEAFRQQRITNLQVDRMAEALEHELVGSILESLHLDELPPRPSSADADIDGHIELPAEDKPAIAFSEDVVQRNFSFESQREATTPPLPPRRRPLLHKTNTSPSMSSRHGRSSSRKIMTELPIIPETVDAPPTTRDSYFSNESVDSLSNTAASEYVYLPSPSLSAIAPTIQHGPIRLSKCDLLPAMKLGHEESLDWTAFQMAISGGAGDLFTESDDVLRRREEEEVADIVDWWGSWHFESTGELVTREYEAPSPTSTLSGDEIPDLSYSEVDSDNQNSPHPRWHGAQRRIGAPGLQLDIGFTKEKKRMSSQYLAADTNNNGPRQRDSEQTLVAIDRQSIQSLPPSPMLDLRVIRSESGDDLDVVPMGYNLGHDLGDFLKWEAEHAFAGDFSSPGLI